MYVGLFLLFNRFFPTAVAHCNVRIVAADEYLSALCHGVTVFIDSGVNDSLLAAFADGFYFGYRVRNLEKATASLKKMGEKVGTQTEADNGYVELVNYRAKLIYMLCRKELTFIRNDRMAI